MTKRQLLKALKNFPPETEIKLAVYGDRRHRILEEVQAASPR